jgi:hypothetical protein
MSEEPASSVMATFRYPDPGSIAARSPELS